MYLLVSKFSFLGYYWAGLLFTTVCYHELFNEFRIFWITVKVDWFNIVSAPDSVSRLFRLVPMPEDTKMLRMDPMVVDHAENKYRRAHVCRWGVSEI